MAWLQFSQGTGTDKPVGCPTFHRKRRDPRSLGDSQIPRRRSPTVSADSRLASKLQIYITLQTHIHMNTHTECKTKGEKEIKISTL